MSDIKPPQDRIRRALRLLGWNALFLAGALALTAALGETYFRVTMPFRDSHFPTRFVPKVGIVRKPNAEIRHTNGLDFWTVARTNSLGFPDREPVSPERAAAGCHVAIIGDSYVEAREVPISDKFPVRLEELASRELPNLDITTSAFGLSGTGQINQLPFYDEYARHLHPKLLVLVFITNDFQDNSPILMALETGYDPEWIPWVSAERRADGMPALRPPHPDYGAHRLPRLPALAHAGLNLAARISYFAKWLDAKIGPSLVPSPNPELLLWTSLLSQRPRYASLLAGWQPTTRGDLRHIFTRKDLPPIFEEALDFTAFGLDQFKARADRDGAVLVILASVRPNHIAKAIFQRMNEMAEARGIPVIDLLDYILRQGAAPDDAKWAHDYHWNAAGHQWAAEALLEYLKRNQEICGGQSSPREG